MEEVRVCKCCGRELPISKFIVSKLGVSKTCNECRSSKIKASKQRKKEIKDMQSTIEESKQLRLQDFSPRDLMLELRRRGYEGTLTFVERHVIDLTKL